MQKVINTLIENIKQLDKPSVALLKGYRLMLDAEELTTKSPEYRALVKLYKSELLTAGKVAERPNVFNIRQVGNLYYSTKLTPNNKGGFKTAIECAEANN